MLNKAQKRSSYFLKLLPIRSSRFAALQNLSENKFFKSIRPQAHNGEFFTARPWFENEFQAEQKNNYGRRDETIVPDKRGKFCFKIMKWASSAPACDFDWMRSRRRNWPRWPISWKIDETAATTARILNFKTYEVVDFSFTLINESCSACENKDKRQVRVNSLTWDWFICQNMNNEFKTISVLLMQHYTKCIEKNQTGVIFVGQILVLIWWSSCFQQYAIYLWIYLNILTFKTQSRLHKTLLFLLNFRNVILYYLTKEYIFQYFR